MAVVACVGASVLKTPNLHHAWYVLTSRHLLIALQRLSKTISRKGMQSTKRRRCGQRHVGDQLRDRPQLMQLNLS